MGGGTYYRNEAPAEVKAFFAALDAEVPILEEPSWRDFHVISENEDVIGSMCAEAFEAMVRHMASKLVEQHARCAAQDALRKRRYAVFVATTYDGKDPCRQRCIFAETDKELGHESFRAISERNQQSLRGSEEARHEADSNKARAETNTDLAGLLADLLVAAAVCRSP